MSKKLTAALLRELLHYDPETGVFTWLVEQRAGIYGQVLLASVGQVAGTRTKRGYVQICYKSKAFLAHRLAFLYMNGELPKNQVDHKDGDKSNNRWNNLRDVTAVVNQQNMRRPQTQKQLQVLGVYQMPSGNFRARIKLLGRNVHIGTFPTSEAGGNAYIAAKRENHERRTI